MKKQPKYNKAKYYKVILFGGAAVWVFLTVSAYLDGDSSSALIYLALGAVYSLVFFANLKNKEQESKKEK